MKHETTHRPQGEDQRTDTTPSAEFVTAISEFFETDPSDLLVELGYYSRQDEDVASSAVTA